MGLVDLFLYPVDLKNPGARWSPALAAGVGLTGKPRDRLFLGFTSNLPPIPGWSFSKSNWYQMFRPYVGIQWVTSTEAVSDPEPGGPQTRERSIGKLAFGLNIPVLSTITRLTDKDKAAKSDTGGTAAKTAATTPATTDAKTGAKPETKTDNAAGKGDGSAKKP